MGSQYRKGAPSAYGMLKYTTTGVALNPANIVSPAAAVGKRWSIDSEYLWVGGSLAEARVAQGVASKGGRFAQYGSACRELRQGRRGNY